MTRDSATLIPRAALAGAGLSLLLLPTTALAASSFPRGPGFYLNLLAFALVLAVYLTWVYTCGWVDRDARKLSLDRTLWNGVIFGGGLLGLLLFWLIPLFLVSFPLLLASCVIPLACYIVTRNALVPESKRVWTEQHLKKVLQRWFVKGSAADQEEEVATGPAIHFLTKSADSGRDESTPAERARTQRGYELACELLTDAVTSRATDLQLEPAGEKLTVRHRIDGAIHPAATLSRPKGEAAIQVFKLLAGLELSEHRKPQEGGFSAELEGRRVDCAVHSAGTVAGEKLGLRLHDRGQRIMNVNQLGMPEAVQQQVNNVLAQDRGLFVICGPAGSGRTTTAYACLMGTDRFQRGVVTIEDPIEYRLPNVDQVALDRRAGETFSLALKRVLQRQSPDILLFGDLRDRETTELAGRKAQDGLLVFGTLAAPDALTGLFRLVELGVPPATLSKTLIGVLAQRLVRLLCSECKVKYRPNAEVLRRANLPADRIKYFCRPPDDSELQRDEAGNIIPCDHCRGIGYHGRTGIFEVLLLNDHTRRLLGEGASLGTLKQELLKAGMKLLHDEAMQLVMDGRTSISEVLQVLK